MSAWGTRGRQTSLHHGEACLETLRPCEGGSSITTVCRRLIGTFRDRGQPAAAGSSLLDQTDRASNPTLSDPAQLKCRPFLGFQSRLIRAFAIQPKFYLG